MYNRLIQILMSCTLVFSTFFQTLGFADTSASKPQPLTVEQFVDKMVQNDHFDRQQLVHLFEQTAYVPEVIDRINAPFEEKPWDLYKNFFITPQRIQAGLDYWKIHADTFAVVEKSYGVSPAVIVAIIGVESNYGLASGKYPELGTLATLSFRYPKRALFFQSELEHFLILSRDYQLSPLEINGSYAGALGMPQFMPDSYQQFGVSLSGKKQINLMQDHDDVIASIANFLQKKGWRPNQPVASPAVIQGGLRKWILSTDAKPTYQTTILEKFGIRPASPVPPIAKAAFIALHDSNSLDEYWLTYPNFYAIMSYNPRTTYAMAVYQFSQALQKAYDQGTAQTGTTAPPPG